MSQLMILLKPNNQSGAIAILTAIMLTMFIGFVALSVDTGHLVVTKNELQNAADAGALAGANALYINEGTEINTGCNAIAQATAMENFSENVPVEVEIDGTNTLDVQRGHWSFATQTFTQNPSTIITDLIGKTPEELDLDTGFINAVEVTARREDQTITSFFARIFGMDSFQQQATAVAYIGFAGKFVEGELEIPIALCEEFVMTQNTAGDDVYKCGTAVLYEHGENAMWSNMDQTGATEDSCNSADASELVDVIETGNPEDLYINVGMGVTNGIVSTAVKDLIDLWEENSVVDGDLTRRKIWKVTLPVIDCIDPDGTENNTCAKLVGGVEVEILWMTKKENNQGYAKTPYEYYVAKDDDDESPYGVDDMLFKSSEADDYLRWNEFATDPDIQLVELDTNGDPTATPLQLSLNQIYFRASCEEATPTGGPGDTNTGVLAERSVLVK